MPDMIAQNQGHIVAIASVLGYEPTARSILYATTKYGIRGLMESLNEMIHMDRINVNLTTVCPLLVNSRKDLVNYFRHYGW